MVRKEVRLDSGLDLERIRFEPGYEEAEIGGRKWGGRVREVAGGQ